MRWASAILTKSLKRAFQPLQRPYTKMDRHFSLDFRSALGCAVPVRACAAVLAPDGAGSAAPVRNHRMQPSGAEAVDTVDWPPRTAAVANSNSLDDIGESQVPK